MTVTVTSHCAAPIKLNCNCGSVPCGEYFLDFRRITDTPVNNQTMLDWYLGEYMLSTATIRSGLECRLPLP